MTDGQKVVLRNVPGDVNGRADELIPKMKADPAYAAFQVTRSAVLRMALAMGLRQMEKEYCVIADSKGCSEGECCP